MSEQWVDFLSQLIATVVGGALVIIANYLTHRHERRREEERIADRNAALMTGLFVIRNFVAEELGRFEAANYPRGDVTGLSTALANLRSIVEKSPPETQYIMATVYDISIRLGDLVSALENTKVAKKRDQSARRARVPGIGNV